MRAGWREQTLGPSFEGSAAKLWTQMWQHQTHLEVREEGGGCQHTSWRVV